MSANDVEQSSASPCDVLLIGVDNRSFGFLSEEFRKIEPATQLTVCSTLREFEDSFEHWEDGLFAAVFAGPEIDGMTGIELAQTLLNQCPKTLRYFLTSSLDKFEPRLLIKNGFLQAYAIPQDNNLLRTTINETVLYGRRMQKIYKPIRVDDVQAGSTLDFSTYVYLPLNDKYVTFSQPQKPISNEKIEKLNEKSMSQLYVEKKDMPKFHQYTADRLRALGVGDGISATERQEKLKELVRTLFVDIFDASIKADFDAGREIVSQTERIISNYITKGASSNWYKRLLLAIGESEDSYSHASNVSTLAALFAIGLGHPHPEELAMAGLFHDLGIATLPPDIQEKTTDSMTPQELELYAQHPERSVNNVKQKRIILTPGVEKAILQHHERWDGKGFPKKLVASKISVEAQILSFADQFDYLTRVRQGKQRLMPSQAWEEIKLGGSINPELMFQIKKLLSGTK